MSTLVLLFSLFLVASGSAQVSIEPPSIDFGEVGTSLVTAHYYQGIAITNTGSEPVIVDAWHINS